MVTQKFYYTNIKFQVMGRCQVTVHLPTSVAQIPNSLGNSGLVCCS